MTTLFPHDLPSTTTHSSKTDAADFEPDDEWKKQLKAHIRLRIQSLVEDAKDYQLTQLSKAVVTPEERMELYMEYMATMASIKQLANDQYQAELEKERNQRRWIAGEPMLPGWSTYLKEEQEHVMNTIKQGGHQLTPAASSEQPNAHPPETRETPTPTSTLTSQEVPIPTLSPTTRYLSDKATGRPWEDWLNRSTSYPERSMSMFERGRIQSHSNQPEVWKSPVDPVDELMALESYASQLDQRGGDKREYPPMPDMHAHPSSSRSYNGEDRNYHVPPPALHVPVPPRLPYDDNHNNSYATLSARNVSSLSVKTSFTDREYRPDHSDNEHPLNHPVLPENGDAIQIKTAETKLQHQAYELRRSEEQIQRRVEGVRTLEEQLSRKEKEVARQVEEARKVEEDARKVEAEVKRKEQEVNVREVEAKHKEDELKKKERETGEKAEKVEQESEKAKILLQEAQKIADETTERQRKLEEDARRWESEIRVREQALHVREEELQLREAEARRREAERMNAEAQQNVATNDLTDNQAYQVLDPKSEVEMAYYIWQQRQFQQQADAIQRKRQKQRQNKSGSAWPSFTPQPPLTSSIRQLPLSQSSQSSYSFPSERSNANPSVWNEAGSTISNSTESTSGTYLTSASLHLTPSEDELQRRQVEFINVQNKFRREQEKMEADMQMRSAGKPLSREDVQRIFEKHERLWKQLPQKSDLTWNDFPWPMTRAPASPDDLSFAFVSAYMQSNCWPNTGKSKATEDRIKEHRILWHPVRFELKLLRNVVESEKEKVKKGVRTIDQYLCDLLWKEQQSNDSGNVFGVDYGDQHTTLDQPAAKEEKHMAVVRAEEYKNPKMQMVVGTKYDAQETGEEGANGMVNADMSALKRYQVPSSSEGIKPKPAMVNTAVGASPQQQQSQDSVDMSDAEEPMHVFAQATVVRYRPQIVPTHVRLRRISNNSSRGVAKAAAVTVPTMSRAVPAEGRVAEKAAKRQKVTIEDASDEDADNHGESLPIDSWLILDDTEVVPLSV